MLLGCSMERLLQMVVNLAGKGTGLQNLLDAVRTMTVLYTVHVGVFASGFCLQHHFQFKFVNGQIKYSNLHYVNSIRMTLNQIPNITIQICISSNQVYKCQIQIYKR